MIEDDAIWWLVMNNTQTMVHAQIPMYISWPNIWDSPQIVHLWYFPLLLCPLVSLLYIVQLCLCPALHCCSSLSSSLLHTPALSLPVSSKSIAFRPRVLVTSATTAYNKQWVATTMVTDISLVLVQVRAWLTCKYHPNWGNSEEVY